MNQVVAGCVLDIDGNNLVAWHHAVAETGVAEVQSVFKDFHLSLYGLVLVLVLVDVLLQVGIKFIDGEQSDAGGIYLDSEYLHQRCREPLGEP